MSRRISFQTLGCKLNQFESEAIAAEMVRRGWKIVSHREEADVCVINTCTVTNKADRKSRHAILQGLGDDVPVFVTGCGVEDLQGKWDEANKVAFWIPNEKKNLVPDYIEAYFRGETAENLSGSSVFGFSDPNPVFRTRGFLKIQDGCDAFCSYCIIPLVRGKAVSRASDDILTSAANMLAQGYKELVLTGVNIGRWEEKGLSWVKLLQKLLDLPGDWRLRVGSMEPDEFGTEFFELFHHPRMTPHLHLSLQSGSDRILNAMRRSYSYLTFRALAENLRKSVKNFHLTTDMIVGFPGESEEDFQKSFMAVREIGFGHVHIFPYSRRRDTEADKMPGQIPGHMMKERASLLSQAALESKRVYRESLSGVTDRLLVEKSHSGKVAGFGAYYVPLELAGTASFEANSWIDVEILGESTKEGALLCKKI